jgi:hypothetical protein
MKGSMVVGSGPGPLRIQGKMVLLNRRIKVHHSLHMMEDISEKSAHELSWQPALSTFEPVQRQGDEAVFLCA